MISPPPPATYDFAKKKRTQTGQVQTILSRRGPPLIPNQKRSKFILSYITWFVVKASSHSLHLCTRRNSALQNSSFSLKSRLGGAPASAASAHQIPGGPGDQARHPQLPRCHCCMGRASQGAGLVDKKSAWQGADRGAQLHGAYRHARFS